MMERDKMQPINGKKKIKHWGAYVFFFALHADGLNSHILWNSSDEDAVWDAGACVSLTVKWRWLLVIDVLRHQSTQTSAKIIE